MSGIPFKYITLLFSVKNVIEVLFFSILFYGFSRWLKRDKNPTLLLQFYGYCVAAFGSYFLGLTTITHVLFTAAPIALALFILIHQETLQKNFIAARITHNTEQFTAPSDWVSLYMRSAMNALNNNKTVICLLERNQPLRHLVDTSLELNVPLRKELITILLHSPSFNTHEMIWLDKHGTLKALNTTVKKDLVDPLWLSETIKHLEQWKQEAVFLTNKTDAVIMVLHHTTRTATIFIGTEIHESLTLHEATTMITHLVRTAPSSSPKLPKEIYEVSHQSRENQPRP